jgi:hypothetical protein
MKLAGIILVLILLGASGYVGYRMFVQPEALPTDSAAEGTGTTTSPLPADDGATANDSSLITRQPSSPDRQVYINQEWRFSFEYPVDWEFRIPAFGSKASLFNMELLPSEGKSFSEPIYINITPKWWIDRLLPDIEKQNNQPRTVLINGRGAIVSTYPYMSIPSLSYLVLINNEYWVDISGRLDYNSVPGYGRELEIVSSTFQFHNPPTLEEVGAEPYIPEYVQ